MCRYAAEQEGLGPRCLVCLSWCMCHGCSGTSDPDCPSPLPLQVSGMIAPTPFGCHTRRKPAASPVTLCFLRLWQPSSQGGAVPQNNPGQSGSSAQPGCVETARVVSVCFLCLISGGRKHVRILHEWSLDFLQPHCQSHWFSNELKGPTRLPGVGPQ